MALVHKSDLFKLSEIDKMVGKSNIGIQTTKDMKNFQDPDAGEDHEWEDVYDLSNVVEHGYDMGNLGEFIGDTTKQKYANFLWVRDPFDAKNFPTIEDFGTLFSFGDFWQQRKGNSVQKFDQPDKEIFNSKKSLKESIQYKEEEIKPTKRLKRFSEI